MVKRATTDVLRNSDLNPHGCGGLRQKNRFLEDELSNPGWQALYDMPEEASSNTNSALSWGDAIPPGKKVAYGGVVFDPSGKILLREPKNHFDGYVWTFAKGRPDPGEKPEQTALREVFEETGGRAKILSPIHGEFVGGTTINRYFLMSAEAGSGGVSPDDKETALIRWVTPEEAHELYGGPLSQDNNAVGLSFALDFTRSGSALPRFCL